MGDTIDFSDGYIIQPQQSYKNLKSVKDTNDYFYSKKLSNQWNTIEEALEENDAEGRLMVWTMFQEFQKHARRKFEQNVFSFSLAEVNPKDLEEQYLKNVSEEEWEDE